MYCSFRTEHFTSKERDAETGLDYIGARYFSGAQGRFTSPDEVFADQHARDPQSWNMYAYARNNPLAFVDIDGRESACVSGLDKDGRACFSVDATSKRPNPVLNFLGGLLKGVARAATGVGNQLTFTPQFTPVAIRMLGLQPTNSIQQRGDAVGTVASVFFMPGPKVEELNPALLMFSQKSVSGLESILESMLGRGYVGAPVDVVRAADGTLITLDKYPRPCREPSWH